MHRSLVLAAVLALTVGLVPGAGALNVTSAAQPVPGVSFTTDNVEHVGYIADLGPTVSARVVQVGDQRRLYVSSIGRGLTIYDVTNPAAPSLIGALPLGGWQNEDMAVSADGDVAVLAYGDSNNYSFNLVIDTSDPTLPRLASRTAGGDHTAECVTPDCSVLYGSEGNIYDLSDIDNPKTVANWIQTANAQLPANNRITGYPHKVVLDAAGYVITDSSPRVVLDISEEGTPAAPALVTAHRRAVEGPNNLRYQHNNLRPRAADWNPRTEENADVDELLPGELLLANGESNLTGTCGGNGGPFITWSMRDFDEGAEITLLETFRPLRNGNYADGDPAVNALGCSGHWFDWTSHTENETYTVAAAWFEHGVRFLEVDAATGKIGEVGFFQPVNGSAGATYWIDDEYVYVTDYVRGIDILKFDPDPEKRPDQDELDANWVANLSTPRLPETQRELAICYLSRR